MDSKEGAALLLHCLSLRSQSPEPVNWPEPTESEWLGLLRQALRHGVAPLLRSRLASEPDYRSRIPSNVSKKLKAAFYSSAYKNLRLLAEASGVFETLQARKIPAIALKGVHLASCVYESVAHRGMVDIDLLVREGDLSRVEEILLNSGYGPAKRPSIESQLEKHYHLMPFTKLGTIPVTIEVHWALEGRAVPFTIDIDGLWARARPAVISGAEVLVFSPEDLLLYLCLHNIFHHQLTTGVRGLCDVLRTTQRYKGAIDWEALKQRAVEWQIEKSVYLMLSLAREKMGARVPTRLLQALEPEISYKTIENTMDELLFGKRTSPEYAEFWDPARSANKVGLLLRSALPSREAMKKMYPSAAGWPIFYVYYPLRWLGLLRRYARVTWQILHGDEAMKAAVRVENTRHALRRWLAPSSCPPSKAGAGRALPRG